MIVVKTVLVKLRNNLFETKKVPKEENLLFYEERKTHL